MRHENPRARENGSNCGSGVDVLCRSPIRAKSETRNPKPDPSSVAAGKSTKPSSAGTAATTNVIATTILPRVEGNPKFKIRKAEFANYLILPSISSNKCAGFLFCV